MNEDQVIQVPESGVKVYELLRGHSKGKDSSETEARSTYLHEISREIKGFSGDPEGFVDFLAETTEGLIERSMMLQEQLDYKTKIELIGIVIDELISDDAQHSIAVDYFNEVIEEEQSILDSTD